MDEPVTKSSAAAHEMIAFMVGSQEFCVDVMSVREIRGLTPVTPIAQAPSFVRGMINLRGKVLPIIDLAARLGFSTTEQTARHAFLVVEIGGQIVGLLVEGVSDIFAVDETLVQRVPSAASTAQAFVSGIVTMDGRLISVIALDAILPSGMSRLAA
jgi:purine-binding chemotaxis protein CheW